jgi:ABC-type nitrate/sulfonate/bicarbonate transport system permease component
VNGSIGGTEKASPEERFTARLVQVAFLVALIALWYLGTNHWGINPLLLPKPQNVAVEFVDILRSGEFWPDLLLTLGELAGAFAISMPLGLAIGFLVSRSPVLVKVFEPLLAGFYAIPIILFLPLYVLFLGLGPASKIALGATISFFPIVLNTIAGFISVDKLHITAARSMGASNWALLRHVLVPGALPVILTGLRMGFTVALLSIIGSETIASLAGLGHRIVHLAESMDMARMFAYIVFVIAIAATLNRFVSWLEVRGRRQ